jgi:hypothetical protein
MQLNGFAKSLAEKQKQKTAKELSNHDSERQADTGIRFLASN